MASLAEEQCEKFDSMMLGLAQQVLRETPLWASPPMRNCWLDEGG
jgi:hypothetical protein